MKIFLLFVSLVQIQTFALEIQGHRGARAVLPENTLPAFEYALKLGIDVLELDVVASKDNKLVVHHDLVINPSLCLTSKKDRLLKPTPIRSLTLAEVKSYDCGTLKNSFFPKQKPVPGTKIPTLQEVLELAKKDKSIKLNIELKSIPSSPELTPSQEEYADLFLAEIKQHELLDRIYVQSFDHRVLKILKQKEPALKLSALLSDNLPDLPTLAKAIGASRISPHWSWITKDDVAKLHEQGVEVVAWTANRPEEWDYLLKTGVDGIITDDPEALQKYLKNKRE